MPAVYFVVIGGTRFIGPFVARELVARGHSVTVLHRGDHEEAMPPSDMPAEEGGEFDFRQDIIYDTSKIRLQLDYREPVEYREGIRRSVGPAPAT